MKHYGRTDANHKAIVGELRHHFYVDDHAATGGGRPDLLCVYRRVTVFVELKHGKQSVLTKQQLKWIGEFPGHVGFATTAEEAIRLVKEPETYALTPKQKDILLMLWAMCDTPKIHFETVKKKLGL